MWLQKESGNPYLQILMHSTLGKIFSRQHSNIILIIPPANYAGDVGGGGGGGWGVRWKGMVGVVGFGDGGH